MFFSLIRAEIQFIVGLSNYNEMKVNGLNSGILMIPTNDSDEDNGDYVVQHSLWWWHKGERYRMEDFARENFIEGANKYGGMFIFITSRLVKGEHKCTIQDVDRDSWTDHLQLKNETTLLWLQWNTERISVGVYKKNGERWGFIFSSDASYSEDIEALCQSSIGTPV